MTFLPAINWHCFDNICAIFFPAQWTTRTSNTSGDNILKVYSQETTTKLSERSSPCKLAPIEIPILSEKLPGYTELDPDTNLHVTGTAKGIELENSRLEITGKIEQPHRLWRTLPDCRQKNT